jgi:hypothetical protein
MITTTDIPLASYDPELAETVTGTLSIKADCIEYRLPDGRAVALELDDDGLRVHAWTGTIDSPVSLALKGNTIIYNLRDFAEEEESTLVDAYRA